MNRVEDLTPEMEQRLRRAARILAVGAIRAAAASTASKPATVPGKEETGGGADPAVQVSPLER